jgi:hypothetical protein
MSHLMSSIERNIILIDNEKADLFGYGSLMEETFSRSILQNGQNAATETPDTQIHYDSMMYF